jgi:hypothetical protein
VRVEHREREGEDEENTRQPPGDLGQNVCRLRAENVFRNRGAKRRSKTLALRALHQNDEHQQNANEDKNAKEQVDQNRHGDGEYDERRRRSKRRTPNIQYRMSNSGNVGIGRSALGVRCLLNLVPNRIQLGKTDIAEFFVSSVKLVFQALESLDKFVGRCLEH